MANSRTIASELADEVADLLGVSNADRRILDWLGMVYNEIVTRSINPLFYEVIGPITIADNSNGADLTADQEVSLGSPMLLVLTRSGGNLVTPEYRPPTDFDKLFKERGGSSVATATEPRFWTLSTSSLDGTEYDGRRSIRYWPQVTEAYNAWLWTTGLSLDDSPAGTDYVWLPYHFEHVLIWGAASIGARIIRPETADAYKAEYENWLMAMTIMLNRAPDQDTTRKSLVPREAEFPMFQGARFPDTIG